jgi:hypothetical protein
MYVGVVVAAAVVGREVAGERLGDTHLVLFV